MMTRRRTPIVVVTAALAIAALEAQAPRFQYERPIAIEAPGPQRLAPDATLFMGAARSRAAGSSKVDLRDLRLFEPTGREVPFLLVYPGEAAPVWLNASVQPLAVTEKTSGFEADLGSMHVVDMLSVEGLPTPFLKRLRLEGSGDRERWTVLAAEGTLFDLPAEQLRQHALPFRAGPYRFLRVTWDDTNSGRVPLPRGVHARRAPAGGVPVREVKVDASFERRPSEPGKSRYRVRLPAPGLPVTALRLEVGGGHVFRTAAVTEASLQGSQAAPREIGRATLSRVVRDDVTAEQLRIPVSPPSEQIVDVVVDDGDNQPLAVRRITLEFPTFPWIYFEASGSSIVARYGDPALNAPRYDLEAARQSIDLANVREASWGEPREVGVPPAPPASVTAMPDAGASLDPSAFRFRRRLVDSPAGLVAIPLDAAVLAHSRGAGRMFEDVRVVDESGRQIPYLLERQEEPLSLDLALRPHEAQVSELRRGTGGNRSTYAVRLPYGSLPNATLVLETSGRVFSRTVSVGAERPADRNHRDPWFETLATRSWTHKEQDLPAPALSLPLGTTRDDQLVVFVDEGDNSALPLTQARLLLPSYRLRLYHPERPLTLVYGRDDVSLPRYDLALLAPQVMGAEARELTAVPAETDKPGPVTSLVSPKYFWAGLVVAVIAIVGVIVRSMRT